MNERIEKYLKQHYCRDYFNAYGETVEDEHYFMYRERVDGLIELIVRECCVTADANIDDSKYPSYWIKKKFGVKE